MALQDSLGFFLTPLTGPLFPPRPMSDFHGRALTVSHTNGKAPFLANYNSTAEKGSDDAFYGADVELIHYLGEGLNFRPE